MKPVFYALVGLIIVSTLSSGTLCTGQCVPRGQTSDPSQSTQLPATTTLEPGGHSSAPNDSQDQKSTAPEDPKKTEDTKEKKDDRMFYVMPNYLTVNGQVPPISWKEKFSITARGTFDPYEFAIVGVVAGIRQAENSYPAFGQGAKGYAKRYGTAFADQVDGNLMVGGVFPTILKTDPRYFRSGTGRIGRRFGYAISRVLIAQKDSGGHMFNVPEFAGNATAIAISNVYYPAGDRSLSSNFSGWGVQMGIDSFGNELKEFWPDIHGYLQKRHARKQNKAVE